MGRNDYCFCGSGKKIKKCHSHLNEESLIANTLKVYHQVDNIIDDYIKSSRISFPCGSGCSECCNHYFYISETEYLCILDYIESNPQIISYDLVRQKATEYMYHLLSSNKEEYEYLNSYMPKKQVQVSSSLYQLFDDNVPFSHPCIFLKSGKCLIYPVRPLICRYFGYIKETSGCKKIDNMKNKSILSANEFAHFTINNFDRFIDKNDSPPILRRPYPISYFFSVLSPHSFDSRYSIYNTSKYGTISQFIQHIQNTHRFE